MMTLYERLHCYDFSFPRAAWKCSLKRAALCSAPQRGGDEFPRGAWELGK